MTRVQMMNRVEVEADKGNSMEPSLTKLKYISCGVKEEGGGGGGFGA